MELTRALEANHNKQINLNKTASRQVARISEETLYIL